MKIDLFQFQEDAARNLLEEILDAQRSVLRGKPQAIVLSSPTGSGKTTTITALMEWIQDGYETYPADPDAIFLWLSDFPELNLQSHDKILSQSSVFAKPDLVVIESSFSQERFEPGKVYFLNTQKLGKNDLLTRTGDGRDYTIWDTIQNTSEACPAHFFVIIDEAHRGMTESKQDQAFAATIVQRFIKGYPEGGMEPVKMIIGMSATPDRFHKLLQGTNRTTHPIDIDPEEVKESGLLKGKIVLYHPSETQPADWALLEAAVTRWQMYCQEWREYCQSQHMDRIVEPVLVIQVEDMGDGKPTRTDLGTLVRVIEQITGRLPDGSWAHAFQEEKELEAYGQKIRKIDASKIDADPLVKIVLFKMSLTTGWDCPRAEVMMSFRRANDATLIAQLVGRMVRTPLARSIEGQEFLNTVALYLPHYDENGLTAILEKLNNPDPDTGVAVSAEDGTGLITVKRDPANEELFTVLSTLPTYRIDRVGKSSNLQRLMKLSRQLTMYDEIDKNALAESKKLIVQTLDDELQKLSASVDFAHDVTEDEVIETREVWVEYGEWKEVPGAKTIRLKASSENIEDLFIRCGHQLGNEGLHMEFWMAHRNPQNPLRAKLELYRVLNNAEAWKRLERVCQDRVDDLLHVHTAKINTLVSSRQEIYRRIRRMAKDPVAETLEMPLTLEIPKKGEAWNQHLYIDENGKYYAELNTWETDTLEPEMKRDGFMGWLRNVPRKPWALTIPYKKGGEIKPLFPDLLVFRRVGENIVVDLFDPHNPGLEDAVEKAKGLAEYALKHGDKFGRIELIAKYDGKLKRLDLTRSSIREDIQKVTSKPHLDQIFRDGG